MPDSPRAAHVIVLHGLWMRGLALSALVQRLRHAGMAAEPFDFMSVHAPLEDTIGRLQQRMLAVPTPVHLIGHSLGGMLALRACHQRTDLPAGRIVCLGAPLTGSAVARQMEDWGAGRLLGHSRAFLEAGIEVWHGPREVGMVAGTLRLGLPALLMHGEGDSDGTVSVEETRIPGLTDHCCVRASHTGLLFSADAARQAVHFLRRGRFRR